MSSNQNKSNRDQQLIEMQLRYGLLTNQAIKLTVMKDQSMNAVSKVTARLCKSGIFNRYPLLPPQHYFTAGKKLTQQRGLSARKTEPLGPQSLPTESAVLAYATENKPPLRRLTKNEMRSNMPWLPSDLSKAAYCLDADGALRLVVVDLGGSPRHVFQKINKAIEARLEIPQLSDMARAGRFQLTALTTSKEKARAIARHQQASVYTDRIRIKLVVIAFLSQILLSQD